MGASLPSYSGMFSSFDSSESSLRYFRVQTEIELAEQIHRSLVPPIAWHASQDEFYGVSAPSGEMGGDLVDLVQDGNKWIVIWQMFPATACGPAY